jgi:hypothetical protein
MTLADFQFPHITTLFHKSIHIGCPRLAFFVEKNYFAFFVERVTRLRRIFRPVNYPVNAESFDLLWNSKSIVGRPAHCTRPSAMRLSRRLEGFKHIFELRYVIIFLT